MIHITRNFVKEDFVKFQDTKLIKLNTRMHKFGNKENINVVKLFLRICKSPWHIHVSHIKQSITFLKCSRSTVPYWIKSNCLKTDH